MEDQSSVSGPSGINNWTWRNNLFYNVELAMSMLTWGFKFYNNTFYQSGVNTFGPLLFTYSAIKGTATNCIAENNIFVNCGSDTNSPTTGWYYVEPHVTNTFAGDYNLVIGTGAGQTKDSTFTMNGQESHGVNGQDPGFVNAAAVNMRLSSPSSPANAGTSLSAMFTFDITGAVRGLPWSIGAYQYSISPPTIKYGTGGGINCD
jgi:hypothetical protein